MSETKKPLHYRYTDDDPDEGFDQIGIANSAKDALAGVRHWIEGLSDSDAPMTVEETESGYFVTIDAD
ncbi:hypothetical protein [Candidatus Contendibacter odensensis]|uniref:Uncharacterized protein n=1 Tax=Candidatus Contendobacter odensis Run_B_J11 TaxID=1400861 RepID=A0A7U7GEM1_9GAMM|nr:hypothetical protein [Candidatus Contendobacter odensis]CDH46983.1 hypothetical protein BN874_690033 [Candidatus Contendobacter odensis Run_B_J11]